MSEEMDELLEAVTRRARDELRESLAPIVARLAASVAELEAALGGGGAPPRRRRGRPKGGSAATTRAPGKSARAPRKRPPGELVRVLRELLAAAPGPTTLAELRDAILARPEYAGRDPKSVYTQTINALKKLPEAKKTPDGYVLG